MSSSSCGADLKYSIQSHMSTFCLSALNMYHIGWSLWPWLGRALASFHLEIKRRETASNYSVLITYSLSSAGKSHRSALNAAVGSLLMERIKRRAVLEKHLSVLRLVNNDQSLPGSFPPGETRLEKASGLCHTAEESRPEKRKVLCLNCNSENRWKHSRWLHLLI